jgi:hypothetical protein
MPARRFSFHFSPIYRLPARALGIHRSTAYVKVGDGMFEARFGPWQVKTPLANVVGASVTGPYLVPKTIGGAHLSFADRGLTFATNARRGACITFRQPVPGIEPLGLLRHPGLTVTVDDPEGLVAALEGSSGDVLTPGTDGSKPEDPSSSEHVEDLIAEAGRLDGLTEPSVEPDDDEDDGEQDDELVAEDEDGLAAALDDALDEVQDDVEDLVDDVVEQLEVEDLDVDEVDAAQPAGGTAAGRGADIRDEDGNGIDDDVEQAAEDRLHTMTARELREFADERGVRHTSSMKKAALVALLEEDLSREELVDELAPEG